MLDLIVSVNKNILKISYLDKDGFHSFQQLLTDTVAHDSRIADAYNFSQVLESLISQLTTTSKTKIRLNFVLEPQDAVLKFITMPKKQLESEENLINEIKTKLDGESLEDYFFSYQKIAPFVYQFIGVRKEIISKYMEISNSLKMPLSSIIPWAALLPKYVGTNDSSIFISNIEDRQILTLSELGGVFFTAVYETSKTPEEFQTMIDELAVYKRAKPINKIYTLNNNIFTLSPNYTLHEIEIPNAQSSDAAGFTTNLLVNYMLDLDGQIRTSHLNLLNLIPALSVEVKQTAVEKYKAPAMAIVVASLIMLLFVGLLKNNSKQNPQTNNLAANTPNMQVLSETTTSAQTSPSTVSVTSPAVDLVRADLKVRIENGSGINGAASKSRNLMRSKGYNVIEIDTASENRSTTLLRFKKSTLIYKDLVINDFKDLYPNAVVEDTLDENSEFGLLQVIGTDAKL